MRRAKTEPVKTHRIFIVVAVVSVILSAGVKLAENEFPVVTFFLLVIVDRATSAEVLDLYRAVGIKAYDYLLSVALPRLVYRVGYDLKNRMLAAVKPVRAENNGGAFSDPVGSVEFFYAFVTVFDRLLAKISVPFV